MANDFIKIYHLIKNDLLRLAYSYTKNLSDAEDIIQEVFIKLYENFSKFNDEDHLKKWCIKVTINKCKNLYFSSWQRKIKYLTKIDENKSSLILPENNLLTAILELPKKYRIVIILYYYNGYKIKEISQILKIKETTIKTQLKRAKNKLEIILKEEGNND